MTLRGTHNCQGDWAINGKEKRLPVRELIGDLVFQVVKFEDIAVKPLRNKTTSRYQNADVRFPCVLIKGGENPLGKPFRMCDGRHRINKLKEQGHTDAVFIIISNDHFMAKFNDYAE